MRDVIVKDKMCCDREMSRFFFDSNDSEDECYVCLKCGTYIGIIQKQLDEDELEGYKEE